MTSPVGIRPIRNSFSHGGSSNSYCLLKPAAALCSGVIGTLGLISIGGPSCEAQKRAILFMNGVPNAGDILYFCIKLFFGLCVNAPVPACLIPYLSRYCMPIHPFWLKMSSRNEQLAIRLMPWLARCVPREHILHIMGSLSRGAYNPYSFCLVDVRHCHIAHRISFRMSDLKDISKRSMMLLLCIYPPSPLVSSASGAMNSMKASSWPRA